MTEVSLDALAQMWRDRDPAPDCLAERVLVGLAMERIDEEYELLHLVDRSNDLAGTRRSSESPLSISFVSDDVSLLLRVSRLGDERRLDGWLAPPQVAQVTVRGVDGERHARVDAYGRFEIATVPAGLVRVVVETVPDEAAPETTTVFVTPAVEL